MISRLLRFLDHLFTTPRLWVPSCRFLVPFPPERPGKSGVAAARRAAHKARRQRRARRHA